MIRHSAAVRSILMGFVLSFVGACSEAPSAATEPALEQLPSPSLSQHEGATVVRQEFSFPFDVVDPAPCLEEDVHFTGFVNGWVMLTTLPDGSIQFNRWQEGRSLIAEGVDSGRLWESRAAVFKANAHVVITEDCETFPLPGTPFCAFRVSAGNRFIYMGVDHDGPDMRLMTNLVLSFDKDGNLLHAHMKSDFLECLGAG